ncbi:hypothetical protein JW906_00155, partial [bacterium]|nr:hypothetical protein [bacterium]
PEIAALLPGAAASGGNPENPRDLFLGLLEKSQGDPGLFETQVGLLRDRLKSETDGDETEALFLALCDRYPASDAGLACLFLMNRIDLTSGQAVFLPAGIPHAYLKGNLVECMANSDNVVRLGLTRKYRDIRIWKELLPENPFGRPVLDAPEPLNDFAYRTPAEEFRIHRYMFETGEKRRFATGNRIEILLLIQGRLALLPDGMQSHSAACSLEQGQSWLIPGAMPEYEIRSLEPSQLFRVCVPEAGGAS